MWFLRYACGQTETDRQTDTLITIVRFSAEDGVIPVRVHGRVPDCCWMKKALGRRLPVLHVHLCRSFTTE